MGGNDIAKVDFWIVGEGRCLRDEFALSTVATVTRVNARYETLCRGVARNFYILRQEIRLGFSAGSAPSWGHASPRKFLYFRPL